MYGTHGNHHFRKFLLKDSSHCWETITKRLHFIISNYCWQPSHIYRIIAGVIRRARMLFAEAGTPLASLLLGISNFLQYYRNKLGGCQKENTPFFNSAIRNPEKIRLHDRLGYSYTFYAQSDGLRVISKKTDSWLKNMILSVVKEIWDDVSVVFEGPNVTSNGNVGKPPTPWITCSSKVIEE